MADVSGVGPSGITGRDTDERVGLGLLARFLGAVFLVLLGGLLLLDRALIRANQNQATLDAQSAGLLTESFMQAHSALLDRVVAVTAGHERMKDSTIVSQALSRLVTDAPGLQRLWVQDTAGAVQMDIADSSGGRLISPELLTRLQSFRPAEQLTISVLRLPSTRSLVVLVRRITDRDGQTIGTAGLALDGDALRSWLERTRPDTRLTLTVLSGADTVVAIGSPGDGAQALAEEQQLVKLPTGGTWRVTSTHALTTRALRWALWALGVFGMSFLALGLLREQRRALDVADRSIELERLYSDVKRANQAKSEFLANVSHELRTPLNAIVGFVELLRDGFYGDLSPRQVPPVDRIAASATHLRHLVDQVLDIAKIAAGRLEVQSETIVLRPFVLNVASELESLVSEKGLAFSITVGASLPRVRTDPTHLRQILINLIGNAVKYTPSGTVSVRARLIGGPAPTLPRSSGSMDVITASTPTATMLAKAPRSGVWIALQVVDSGVGISPADVDRIFDEFEQVDARARSDSMQRGTGLGLAISRRLARLLGGEISVDSEVGRGSTFTVWLPVNPADLSRERMDSPASGVPASAV